MIDATEWVGPLHDLRLGLYQAAKYYYYPGWHEPGTYLEYFFNKKVYDGLPKDLQHIIDAACTETEHWVLAQFEARNGEALQTLINDKKAQLLQIPDQVMAELKKLADEVVAEEAAKTPMATKVNNSFKAFPEGGRDLGKRLREGLLRHHSTQVSLEGVTADPLESSIHGQQINPPPVPAIRQNRWLFLSLGDRMIR